MDFRNVNLLNNRVNLLSGNLLPIVSDNSRFPIIWRIYSAVVWIMEVIHVIAFIFGFILTPIEKSLKDGTVCIAIVVEASFMLTSLYSHKKLMDEMVQKMNGILQSADEIMNNIVKLTIKPVIMPYTIYAIVTVFSITMWTIQPVTLVFKKSTFFYTDYNLPTAFTTEPFSSRVLVPSTIFMTIASVYVFLKKFGVDMYMVHLVLMLTAQYRYTAVKLKILFRDLQNNHDKSQNEHLIKDQWTERELKKLCSHQTTVLQQV